jgi:hypothetical protein
MALYNYFVVDFQAMQLMKFIVRVQKILVSLFRAENKNTILSINPDHQPETYSEA